jgi:coenzyme F420 hydrogenase subunit delta
MPISEENAVPDFCRKPVLILGCGNVLFGDDGFGCALAEHLEAHFDVPESVCLADAGTGVRKLLFTLCLSDVRPRRILIADAIDVGREPGDWFEIDPAEIPSVKLDDFSLHQLPTSNLLRELQQQAGIEVRVLACQTGPLPDHVSPGLSAPVQRAVEHAAKWVAEEYLASVSSVASSDGCSRP